MAKKNAEPVNPFGTGFFAANAVTSDTQRINSTIVELEKEFVNRMSLINSDKFALLENVTAFAGRIFDFIALVKKNKGLTLESVTQTFAALNPTAYTKAVNAWHSANVTMYKKEHAFFVKEVKAGKDLVTVRAENQTVGIVEFYQTIDDMWNAALLAAKPSEKAVSEFQDKFGGLKSSVVLVWPAGQKPVTIPTLSWVQSTDEMDKAAAALYGKEVAAAVKAKFNGFYPCFGGVAATKEELHLFYQVKGLQIERGNAQVTCACRSMLFPTERKDYDVKPSFRSLVFIAPATGSMDKVEELAAFIETLKPVKPFSKERFDKALKAFAVSFDALKALAEELNGLPETPDNVAMFNRLNAVTSHVQTHLNHTVFTGLHHNEFNERTVEE